MNAPRQAAEYHCMRNSILTQPRVAGFPLRYNKLREIKTGRFRGLHPHSLNLCNLRNLWIKSTIAIFGAVRRSAALFYFLGILPISIYIVNYPDNQ